MNILVTGASGFFGSTLVPRLIAAQHRVTEVSRTAAASHGLDAIGVDLRDRDATARALAPWRWQAVVHLAGPAPKSDQSWDDSVATITAHVRSIVHVIAAIPNGWEGRFVHASGAIVYGNPTTERIAEDHPRHPLHAYALAKCLAEDVLLGSTLTDRFALRMGGLFSERRRSGGLFQFARAAHAGQPIRVTTSSPPVPWEILDIDDAAEAVIRSLGATARDVGAINIGYGERIQIVEIAERLARRADRGSTVTLDGPMPPAFHADISKAGATLAWPPASLDARLDRMLAAVARGDA